MPLVVPTFIQQYLRLGTTPHDRGSVRLAKAQFMGGVPIGIALALPFGLVYLIYQEVAAAYIAFGFGALMILNVACFALMHRNVELAFNVQAALALLTGLAGAFVLGSFANSSGAILYGLIYVLMGGRYSRFWFTIFLLFLVAAIFWQPLPRDSINVPSFVVSLLWVINVSNLSAVLLAMYRYVVAQRNIAYRQLRGEQERAESLLLNILPSDVATILKNKTRTIAEHFENASVLFADVVNFTPMSAQMTPVELVEVLNEVFSAFDVLAEKYGLEKIKTIGDCYMVAAGVPRARPDHAQALTRMALEMQAYVATREFHGHRLTFRIGLNSGAVVAGVIGRKKFAYDLWGDAVNTASRMESHGLAGAIQITRSTYELVKQEFVCEPRGSVYVKGKGEMETWHVIQAKRVIASAA
jgi:adenylate cyclase